MKKSKAMAKSARPKDQMQSFVIYKISFIHQLQCSFFLLLISSDPV